MTLRPQETKQPWDLATSLQPSSRWAGATWPSHTPAPAPASNTLLRGLGTRAQQSPMQLQATGGRELEHLAYTKVQMTATGKTRSKWPRPLGSLGDGSKCFPASQLPSLHQPPMASQAQLSSRGVHSFQLGLTPLLPPQGHLANLQHPL